MEATVINGEKYYWAEMSPEDFEEFLNVGYGFYFRFNDMDYYVEGISFDVEAKGRVGYYYIEDENDELHESKNKLAKTPDEFKALPFLDGKTIIERFGELRFFNG